MISQKYYIDEFSHDRHIDSAYIITLSNNEISKKLSDRCKKSCDDIEMPNKIWEGFDATNNEVTKIPEHLENQYFVNWLKVHNSDLTKRQIACVLSHFSLWCHCLTIDKPIVILEHDALMLKPLRFFDYYNQILYLGNKEQLQEGRFTRIPAHGTWYNTKLRFINRAHAYAIDPQIAKNMITFVIKTGIIQSLDGMIRSDIFPIVQEDLYAIDMPGISTIHNE